MDKKSLLEMYNFCKKNNLEFISMYGSSEATSRMSYLPFINMKKKIGSIGGDGGMIGIDKNSNISMEFNTPGMYRAYVNKFGEKEILLYEN